MRNGGDKRGKARDRRRRKEWLLRKFGNGSECPCVHCQKTVTFETLEVDRIVPGGSYCRANVQPSCIDCNRSRSNSLSWIGRDPLQQIVRLSRSDPTKEWRYGVEC